MLDTRQDNYEKLTDLISRLALAGLAVAMLLMALAGFLTA
jgi:hypothetical protein